MLHMETFESPIIYITSSGEDSLLVYTFENVLFHYVIGALDSTITLTQVGQIGLQGIIRAPLRVRSVSWIVPEEQLRKSCYQFSSVTSAKLLQTRGTLRRTWPRLL